MTRAFLLRAIETFAELFQEFGVDAKRATQVEGVPEELSRMKYGALLIDFDAIVTRPVCFVALLCLGSKRTSQSAI